MNILIRTVDYYQPYSYLPKDQEEAWNEIHRLTRLASEEFGSINVTPQVLKEKMEQILRHVPVSVGIRSQI